MPDTSPTCKLGFNQSGPNSRIPSGTERLLFLTMAVILNLTVLDEAKKRQWEGKLVYWDGYFPLIAEKLMEIVNLRPNLPLDTIGVRIIEIMACFIVKKNIQKGPMRMAIKVFLKRHSKKAAEIMENSGVIVAEEYPTIFYEREDILRCVECREEHPNELMHTFEKRHEKISFGVYAGPCLAAKMTHEQVHAAAAIPKLRVCKEHLAGQAELLKTLDFKLLDKDFYERFRQAMSISFGKGLMDPLKMVNCFINKYGPRPNNKPARCKFCKNTDKHVLFDELLQTHAHWKCFQARSVDIQWDLRMQTIEDDNPKITIYTPEELETLTGEALERALKGMRNYFGKRDVPLEHERMHLLILFARYWQHDPKIEMKLMKENERLPRKNRNRTESPDYPDDIWATYKTNEEPETE